MPGAERVDEKACAAKQDVADPLHSIKRVVDACGRRQELMLAHVEFFSGLQMNREDVPDTVPAERDPAMALGLSHEDRHASEDSLERTLHRFDADFHTRILPQKNVMLEVDICGLHFNVKHGDELSLDVVGHSGERLVARGGGEERGNRHDASRGGKDVRADAPDELCSVPEIVPTPALSSNAGVGGSNLSP